MKIQTGLQKLTKRFFELLTKNDKQAWEYFYKEVDDKYHNILKYQDEGGEHPDSHIWTALYESTCSQICKVHAVTASLNK